MRKFPPHRPRQIEFIQQRSKADCGIACVAMLAGLLYESVRSVVGNVRSLAHPESMIEMLEDLEMECEESSKLPARGTALVALQWNDHRLPGHYVVWDSRRKQFLDPRSGVVNRRDMMRFAKIDHIWTVRKRTVKEYCDGKKESSRPAGK